MNIFMIESALQLLGTFPYTAKPQFRQDDSISWIDPEILSSFRVQQGSFCFLLVQSKHLMNRSIEHIPLHGRSLLVVKQ